MRRAVGVVIALWLAAAPMTARAADRTRNDYANLAFSRQLGVALRDFYARDFAKAQSEFAASLKLIPDNTLAIAFLNAAASHVPGALETLVDAEEDEVGKTPKSYLAHVRLAFSYLFEGLVGRDRTLDAREEFNVALGASSSAQAAHVGIGIMRQAERSAHRAKVEFLAALRVDPNNVLAREYLASIYQVDLRDPATGLKYAVDVPNLVPGYADIQFHLASIMDDLSQYDAAVGYAKRGIDLDVGRVGEAGQFGYTLIAQILLKQKKVTDAKKYLEEAVAFDADGMYARKLLERISKGEYGSSKQ